MVWIFFSQTEVASGYILESQDNSNMKPPYKQLEYLKFLERENVNKIKQGICLQALHTLAKCLGYNPWGRS